MHMRPDQHMTLEMGSVQKILTPVRTGNILSAWVGLSGEIFLKKANFSFVILLGDTNLFRSGQKIPGCGPLFTVGQKYALESVKAYLYMTQMGILATISDGTPFDPGWVGSFFYWSGWVNHLWVWKISP